MSEGLCDCAEAFLEFKDRWLEEWGGRIEAFDLCVDMYGHPKEIIEQGTAEVDDALLGADCGTAFTAAASMAMKLTAFGACQKSLQMVEASEKLKTRARGTVWGRPPEGING
jgi:hypothetical protein